MRMDFFRYFKISMQVFLFCALFFVGIHVEAIYAEETGIQNDYVVQNQEEWNTEITEDGRARIIGFSENIDLNQLVIPSSINGRSVEVNLKEVFGEILQTQTKSFTIENSKEGLQPVKLTGEFNSLFSKQFSSSGITRINFGDADTSSITNMESMFFQCRSLNFLNLGENFDTSNVKNMRKMFNGTKLKEIDLGGKFNTSKVEMMDEMFSGCFSLESLNLGDQFDTSNVQSMKWMFFRCLNLKTIDLGNHFDTKNVQSMAHMFSTCNSLAELKLGEWFDTSNVSDITGMFLNCVKLRRLDLEKKFDTSNVKNMMYTFENCENLEKLTLGDKFNTSSVERMDAMFSGCKSLTDFSFLENFDTSQVKSMYSMFQECLEIENLELNFDTQNVHDMNNLFSGCTNLKEVILGENFNSKRMTDALSYKEMFKGCNELAQLTIPGSFQLGENIALKDVPLEEEDCYWAYKKEKPMTTKEFITFHNRQPASSMNSYMLKKAYQISFDVTNIPITSQFPEKIFWEDQEFEKIPKEYTVEGYEIQWSVDGKPFNESIPIKKSMVIKGEATPIIYTITFDSNGGEKVKAITYTIIDTIEQLPTPTMKDYIFDGWWDSSGRVSHVVKGTIGDKNLSAQWVLDKSSLEELLKNEESLNRLASVYTSKSWENYSKAIEEAKEALENKELSLKKFTTIKKEFLQAIEQLKEVEKEQTSTLSFEGLSDCTIEKGKVFDPKAGVKAIDSVEGDLTNKIKIVGTVDTSKVGSYLLTYSVENSVKKKLEKDIRIQVVESGEIDIDYHTVEVPQLTLPRFADYKQAIKDKMVIKNSKGEVVSAEEVDFSITSEKDTSKLGEMTALVTIPYVNGTSTNTIVKITVISGIEIVSSDTEQLFYVGDKKESFDPYSVFQAFEIGVDGTKKTLERYDANKKFGIKVINNPVDFSKAGEYAVDYLIINSFGEKVEQSFVISVKNWKHLKLEAEDKIMYVGDSITEETILSWAKTENADTLQFEELGQGIPKDTTTNSLTKAGEYFIRYCAYQNSGETAELTIKLIVLDRTLSTYPMSLDGLKNMPNTNKKNLGSSAKKTTYPKTGSVEANSLVYVIGLLMIVIVIRLVSSIKEKNF